MNRKNLLFITAVILAIGALVFYLLPDEEKQVRKQLNLLEQLASKQAKETGLQSIKKAAQISSLFTDPCRLKVERLDFEGEFIRKEVINHIQIARNSFSQVNVQFHDITIEFPNKTTANVIMTLQLTGKNGGENWADTHEIDAGMIKNEGDWLLSECTLIEVLKK